MPESPTFHHIHLNSVNPEAAIEFYVRQFPSTRRGTWAGEATLESPNDVRVLFTRVETPPATELQTAIWHFGWHVTNARKSLETYRGRSDVELLPLYTTEDGGAVFISSDTWPSTGGVLGLTRTQIAEARARDIKPSGGGGFAYMAGPDGAIVEYAGDYPAERFNHVHLYQEDPFCAQLWYQRHLGARLMDGGTGPSPLTEDNCAVTRGPELTWPALEREGMFRSPKAAVTIGDVMLTWYAAQTGAPLVSSRGHLVDHIGLGVTDLDAWVRRLRGEGVTFLEEPYPLGDTRAVMIEGPSREALELVEVR
jgi:catechol 2,3-dioxygenase-like lactoylglutathione lyase family enzyme